MCAPGATRPDNLDIEQHFAVGAVRVGGLVLPLVDRYGNDRGLFQSELLEVSLQIGRFVTASEFDDSHRLARSVDIERERVELRDLSRGIRNRGGRFCLRVIVLVANPKVGLRLWAIVQPQHGFD